MEFLYFLVTGSDSWENQYHQNFFVTQGGFTFGFVAALIIGVLFSCIFYFGFCNSKNTQKSANMGVWAVCLLIAIVIGYLFADYVIIGDSTDAVFRDCSFYKANDEYYVAQTRGSVSPAKINDLASLQTKIKSDLDKGGDVRLPYDITTAVLTAIFFFLASIGVKRFTISGKAIPFLKP